ncbi:hypothetical protein DCC39_14505 [Pueribacillus theae]|uniref:DUF5067 domain-containing protein n=1 Tax=Pueribacillus theae TaxID=2171751 RepID=A0A2U1JTX1_9BACI|nr:hypothetical protein [Pueribacillus theae]PWA08646.1 hypothetical protein DCC39_14505 [Pueribacillus theae]
MKKVLFIFAAVLFVLVGCGSNEKTSDDEVVKEQPDVQDDQQKQVDEEGFLKETDDPMEAGNKNNGIEVFNDEWDYTYLIKDWYSNDDTDEDGFNYIDFDGYKVKFSIALLEDTEEKNVIGVFAETLNDTDKTVQYNMDMELITDKQEQAQTDDMYGIGNSKPGIKTKGFVKVDLEYEVPESFKVTFEPPWDDEDEFNETIGEPIESEFTKE